MIIVDTNVISERFKPAPDQTVIEWFDRHSLKSLYTTTITLAEVLSGVQSMPDGKRRNALAAGVEAIFASAFENRILAFDEAAAREFARLIATGRTLGRRVQQLDTMIAAICRSHGAALATRNTADFEHCGIELINPWQG